ncbi:response regulator transcription factor family protein [Paenarthrobacter aurescens]|uniref:Helix-turn-helix transcriptional regulator n=1 Tax=Paenarthrobacter aurescens TaxID=43663 RepID=A0A4Y3NP71_PAEAU|nr:LuxR C-terminal-related transcriptional regulator [Paenarthrobacter aurescens]MDO6142048.1 LuxR C-terminal-related transcriptional regulator [Paenarthrobacter aurescens]MDO6145852.1 LuxR C-terminal-related transcriptional regulator [Paenarthrobacter aurescens]MDO6157097.1 LuxR C-terminal-related transcriptional regulator [Paenarthrobacter aurescens]MDO6161083.1 LuxR C-terminal-related transcriptional regulator [Paenarthrobacter aurescens]GEB20986.1 helix-turn-helix transcriptional regulator
MQNWTLLHAVSDLAAAPLNRIAEVLRDATLPFVQASALIIFTEECTGRPQKKAGDEGVVSRVSITELDRLGSALPGEGPWRTSAVIAGQEREVLALGFAPSQALLVLTDPSVAGGSEGEEALRLLDYLWRLTARRIQEKVTDAPPSYLLESRAASAERIRVTAELIDQHSTTLETLLAALRSTSMNDAAARASVTDLAVKALVDLRTVSDRTSDLVEEPVATAFERLREDLRPLMHFSNIDMQFIEPPANGRALPGEVAHAARAVVRGLVLAIAEQPDVRRVRAQWDCDGENLLINVRDDGLGALTPDSPSIARLQQRVQAVDGRMSLEVMQGWGADISVVLPLDPPASPAGDVAAWDLAPRELEVLQLLTAGQRNRSIAGALHISENTVKFHVRNLFRKLNVRSRTEAIALAHSAGLR